MTKPANNNAQPNAVGNTEANGALRAEVARGLAYLHNRTNGTLGHTLDAASFLYALIEVLDEKGIVSIAELDARKPAVAERLLQKFMRADAGVALQTPDQDKYRYQSDAEIDCASRVHLCKAACCKMIFPLSRQDIEEGVIQWQLDKPYVIAKQADGYCRHFDRERCACTVHAQRPIPCRAYDCRGDRRIWLNFERRIVNPKLEDPRWPHNLSPEEMHMTRSELP